MQNKKDTLKDIIGDIPNENYRFEDNFLPPFDILGSLSHRSSSPKLIINLESSINGKNTAVKLTENNNYDQLNNENINADKHKNKLINYQFCINNIIKCMKNLKFYINKKIDDLNQLEDIICIIDCLITKINILNLIIKDKV